MQTTAVSLSAVTFLLLQAPLGGVWAPNRAHQHIAARLFQEQALEEQLVLHAADVGVGHVAFGERQDDGAPSRSGVRQRLLCLHITGTGQKTSSTKASAGNTSAQGRQARPGIATIEELHLGHDSIVGSHHQNDNVSDGSPACAHGRERRMPWCVQECCRDL